MLHPNLLNRLEWLLHTVDGCYLRKWFGTSANAVEEKSWYELPKLCWRFLHARMRTNIGGRLGLNLQFVKKKKMTVYIWIWLHCKTLLSRLTKYD